MIKLIILGLMYLHYTPCYQEFLKNVFDTNFYTNTQFCYVKIKRVDSVEMITANNTLETIFMKEGKMTKGEYINYMITNYDSLVLPSSYKNGYSGFLTVKKDCYVDSIALKGKSDFVDHFFIDRTFREEYSEHFNAVVSRLFDFGIVICIGEWNSKRIVFDFCIK